MISKELLEKTKEYFLDSACFAKAKVVENKFLPGTSISG